MSKVCNTCNQEKELSDFSPKQAKCKSCRRAKKKPKHSDSYYKAILNYSSIENIANYMKVTKRTVYNLIKDEPIYNELSKLNGNRVNYASTIRLKMFGYR